MDEPRRRSEDCVSFRDMVEYVAESETRYHTVRAESLIQVSNSLEKLEAKLESHEEWHTRVLEQMLTTGQQNRLAVYAIVISAVTLLASLGTQILTLSR